MTDELPPVRCGCGGEARIVYIDGEDSEDTFVECTRCKISTPVCPSEEEAVEDWNRAMGSTEKSSTVERTAKAIEHDASVTDTDGYKYHRSEYLCGECKKKILSGDDYCSHCGAKLDWSE